MEDSSTIIKSADIGSNFLLLKKAFNLINLCIVVASLLVNSVILLDAFPVGADNLIIALGFILSIHLIIVFIVCVFPVPGPPVIILIPFFKLIYTASFCFLANLKYFFS